MTTKILGQGRVPWNDEGGKANPFVFGELELSKDMGYAETAASFMASSVPGAGTDFISSLAAARRSPAQLRLMKI